MLQKIVFEDPVWIAEIEKNWPQRVPPTDPPCPSKVEKNQPNDYSDKLNLRKGIVYVSVFVSININHRFMAAFLKETEKIMNTLKLFSKEL